MHHLYRSLLIFIMSSVAARASQVVFSEVMYHPLVGKPEFIEVQNLTPTPLDTVRWRFSDGIDFTFPDFNAGASQAHFLAPNERILLSAANDADTRAAYPGIPSGTRIFGPWVGSLDNNGERVTLKDKNGVVMVTLKYGNGAKWPVQADGAGHSLVLANDLRAPDDWRLWRASTNRNGSPGVADPAPSAVGLALNELHFAATTRVDWVEVRNNSRTSSMSASGLFVASLDDFSNKVALSGSVTPGAVMSANVDFASDSSGDVKIYLIDASNNVRDAVKVRRKAGRDSWQVFPAGSREWYSATTATRDGQNAPARNTDIVINEIMADPPSNQRDGEFVELYNRSAAAVNVGGWKLNDAVDLTIPAGTTIPAGGYLVLAANAAWLNSAYSGLSVVGNWSGSLGNGGDRLRLEDADGNLVNQVDYRFGGEWPEQAGGNGSSLELVNPSADNTLGGAWRDSDESTKSAFTSYTLNLGTYGDQTQGGVNDDELLLWLVGDAHLILKNFVLRPTAGGANLFANGAVTTLNNENVSGWQSRGTHWQTFSDAAGVHVIADGHGDNKCNHLEKDASTASGSGLVAGTAYTLTFDARWVNGKPRVVVQSWDTTLGGTALVPIPLNLGTPGAPNSRLVVAAPPPQLTALAHSPVVPTLGATMTITTRVSSADALNSVLLYHRLDSTNLNAAWTSTTMVDNGSGGDVSAGDGIYTAQIPLASFGYSSAGAIVQYYVHATTGNNQSSDLPKTGPASPGLWIVDAQAPSTDLRRMRVIVPIYWSNALDVTIGTGGNTVTYNYKFPKLSNHYFPCVFIHNDSEIYYDCQVRKTGSPFTRGTTATLDRASVVLPGDHEFRGQGSLYWDNDGAGSTMLHNRTMRYMLYLLGMPGNENEVCRVAKNNATYAVRESSESFGKDMLNRIWDNGSSGQLFEMDDKFHIRDDGATLLANANATWDYKVGDSQGADNPTAYHNNFIPKSREFEYDYAGMIAWCKQLETNAGITPEQLERMSDTRTMTAYAAVRGYAADWDNITMGRGKNGYFYQRSTDQKFTFLHWDSDNAFQASHINDAVVGTLTNVGTTAPGYYSKPYVRRYLNYFLNQMCTTYALGGPRLAAWLAAEETSSSSFVVPATYATWPSTLATSGSSQSRVTVIQNFIGITSMTATFALSTPADGATVGTNTVDISGTAPISAFSIACVGHPEAVFSWTATATTDVSPWKLAGIQIAGGANVLTFRAYDDTGVQVGGDLTRTINRSGNVPPVVVLASDPPSLNAALGEIVSLDVGASYDPENAGPLSYSWTITPAAGFSTAVLSPSARQLVFTTPGSYNVTVQATDASSQTAVLTRTLSVFNASDRDDFGGKILSGYNIQNMELRDNYSPGAWYSLGENVGKLTVQVLDSASKPLNLGVPTFPLLTRSVPSSGDFFLQTNLGVETPQFGAFFSGLYLETLEGGTTIRYAFGLEAGTALVVYLSTGSGSYAALASVAYNGGDITLRVQRSGSALNFQKRVNGVWTNVATRSPPAGSTATSGGIFSTTSSALNSRVDFDYLLLANPGNSTDLGSNLRITELMYNPAGAAGVEFVELQNIGAGPLNLLGAYFEAGDPYSTRFTFGDLTLQPGQYCVVTNDAAAFQALYGTNATIAGQGTGSLNNDGERLTLKDAAGNVVLDFSYGDTAPWPTAADGGGKSLEVMTANPALYGNGANWRASQEDGGSPGYLGMATDSDADGVPDTVELAYGSDPNSAASRPLLPATSRDAGSGAITLSWPSLAGRVYIVQYRDDWAGTWSDLASVTANSTTTGYTDASANGQTTRFYRISTRFP